MVWQVDYEIVRPFGDDRYYIALGAAVATLQTHAERITYRARLRSFRTQLERRLHAGTGCVPSAYFERKLAAEFVGLRSSDRISLLMHLIEDKGAAGGR